ncbi:MAG: SRPBCC family protein [Pseudonocardiaceae bacterium]
MTPAPTATAMSVADAAGFDYRCTETVVIARDAEAVRRALHDVAEWPRWLPHVLELDVRYDDGQYQEFFMTVDSEGRTLRVRSIRNCRRDLIEFFQPEPPAFLRHHAGCWRIRPLNLDAAGQDRTEVSATHVWNLEPDRAAELYPATAQRSTAQRVTDVLAGHSRLALDTWQRVLAPPTSAATEVKP